jgi:hypothetical protein
MISFWDTSAVLELVYVEPRTPEAVLARSQSVGQYAWRWMAVEAQAGLARRRARPAEWDALQAILKAFTYIDLSPEQTEGVGRANREWRLRASDAGHLYCFHQVSFVLPDIELVCFDDEITAAANALGLPVWAPRPAGEPPDHAAVRERHPGYGGIRGRKKARRL